jgi:hypothetical protein
MILTTELVAQIEQAVQRIADVGDGFGRVALVIEKGRPKLIESSTSEIVIQATQRPPPRAPTSR